MEEYTWKRFQWHMERRHARRSLLKFLFLGLFRHALVRIRPLGILALCRVKQVLRGIPQLTQLLEPELRMLLSFYFKIATIAVICM